MADFLIQKKSNCKNCYKCIRHCPVKAIRFSGNQAHIINDECILCGECYVVCPQEAKVIVDGVEKTKVLLQSKSPVIVSLAPSFLANFEGVGFEAMARALKKLGFTDVEETAIGATIVKNEYQRMLQEDDKDIIISSCCHSVNLLIQKYFPSALPYLADVVSPMIAHCRDIKIRNPEAKTVFIGPCIAKKDEAGSSSGIVDAVLTYDELAKWFAAEGIKLELALDSNPESRARLFPTTGGVLKTMDKIEGYTYLAVDGVDNCIAALKDIVKGNIHRCFIEMSACIGSCIGGPTMDKSQEASTVKDYLTISNYAGERDFPVTQPAPVEIKREFAVIETKSRQPSEAEIMSILRQMGKFKAADELNCGSCGYNSCREKAIAVYQGKAETSMCLPNLLSKAESFSDTIVKNTPNGLIVLNENLEVQQINKVAQNIMNIRSETDVLGEPVVRILDPDMFKKVRDTGRAIHGERTYLAEYKRYVEQTISYDGDSHLLIGIMRDITNEVAERDRKVRVNQKTVEVADSVVEKQMRIVQEIASLLGETAAETKIALTKLKESLGDE